VRIIDLAVGTQQTCISTYIIEVNWFLCNPCGIKGKCVISSYQNSLLLYMKPSVYFIYMFCAFMTMLQAGKSQVWDLMRWMNFFNLPNPSGSTKLWALLSL
jgi:hypothetical protein